MSAPYRSDVFKVLEANPGKAMTAREICAAAGFVPDAPDDDGRPNVWRVVLILTAAIARGQVKKSLPDPLRQQTYCLIETKEQTHVAS